MKWIDESTMLLNDGTIIVFGEVGNVELFPGKDWKRQETTWQFHFQGRDQAISVFNEIRRVSDEN